MSIFFFLFLFSSYIFLARGIGLGLEISSQFAILMGGKLTVSSTVGIGSTFSFEFPLRFEEVGARISSPAVKGLIHIMLPQSHNRDALSRMIGNLGVLGIMAD